MYNGEEFIEGQSPVPAPNAPFDELNAYDTAERTVIWKSSRACEPLLITHSNGKKTSGPQL